MRPNVEIQYAHDLTENFLKGEIPNAAPLTDDDRTIWEVIGSVLCWVLGHENGKRFEDQLRKIEGAIEAAGKATVLVPPMKANGKPQRAKLPPGEQKPHAADEHQLSAEKVAKLRDDLRSHMDVLATTNRRAGITTTAVMTSAENLVTNILPRVAPLVLPERGLEPIEDMIQETQALLNAIGDWHEAVVALSNQYSGVWQTSKVFYDSLDKPD